MNTNIFERLISNLLTASITKISDLNKNLKYFEEKNCLVKPLQPMFTADALTFLITNSKSNTLYEIQDKIGVCATFFTYNECTYIIGPYVKDEFNDTRVEQLLVENLLPASINISIKLYYTSFPIVYSNQILNIVNAVTTALSPETKPYNFRPLTGFIEEKNVENEVVINEVSEVYDYSKIYKRYDAEHRFIHFISVGDVESVKNAQKEMIKYAEGSGIYEEYANYVNPIVGFTIIRVLARKAAEEGGLSIITINEITQKYTQLVDASTTNSDVRRYIQELVIELTTAVYKHKKSSQNYPPIVTDCVEYITLHLCEDIKLADICDTLHVSASHLSKIFKAATGKTISEYIALSRCEKAADLLKNTNYSISEISNFVGYSDNNYFVKVFKKIYEVTPSAYKSQALELT